MAISGPGSGGWDRRSTRGVEGFEGLRPFWWPWQQYWGPVSGSLLCGNLVMNEEGRACRREGLDGCTQKSIFLHLEGAVSDTGHRWQRNIRWQGIVLASPGKVWMDNAKRESNQQATSNNRQAPKAL